MPTDYLDHTKRAGLVPALFLLMAFIFAGMFVLLAQRLSVMHNHQTEQYLAEIASNTANTVHKHISANLESMRTAAALLGHHNPFDAKEAISFLKHSHFRARYKRMGIILPDGTVYTTMGDVGKLDAARSLLMESLRGTVAMHGTLVDRYDGETITAVAAPITQNNRIMGVVFSTYPTQSFSQALEIPVLEGRGNSYIINQHGEGITPSFRQRFPDNNLFSSLKKTVHVQGITAEQLTKSMARGQSGVIRMYVQGKEYYFAYAPVPINGWYTLVMLPYGVVNERIGNTITLVLGTVGTWLVLFVAFIAYVLYYQRRARREALQQASHVAALVSSIPGGVLRCRDDQSWTIEDCSKGFEELTGYSRQELRDLFQNQLLLLLHPEDQQKAMEQQEEMRRNSPGVTLDYRMVRKDNQIVWIVDRSQLMTDENGAYWSAVLVDVSERKRSQDRRRIEEERYRILFEMSDSILYEFDLRTGIMNTTRKFFEKFEYPLPSMQTTQHPVDMNIFHPEDISQFHALQQALKDGAPTAEAIIRICKYNEEWLWCHVHQTALHDVNHNCIKALGKITNVDAETRALHKLRDDVQRDPFTGLYNKTATAELVTKSLLHGSSDRGALCIIDADNFKQINDCMGHAMGDTVLKQLAQGLALIFRSSDIVGRVGGDEFIVFLKDIKKLRALLFKMDMVIKLFQQTLEHEGKQISISASIGIALCPKDGTDFDQLYRHADKALYRSKVQKNTYNFYDPDLDSP